MSNWAINRSSLTLPPSLGTSGTNGFLLRTSPFGSLTPSTPSEAPHLLSLRRRIHDLRSQFWLTEPGGYAA
jgi:hypothetical protein